MKDAQDEEEKAAREKEIKESGEEKTEDEDDEDDADEDNDILTENEVIIPIIVQPDLSNHNINSMMIKPLLTDVSEILVEFLVTDKKS